MGKATQMITVGAPLEVCFHIWAGGVNLPTIVDFVKQVRSVNRQTFWTWELEEDGQRISWDTVINEARPQQLISWVSPPGETVKTTGFVFFRPVDKDQTEVTLDILFNLPFKTNGDWIPEVFHNPSPLVESSLNRFKQLVERKTIPIS